MEKRKIILVDEGTSNIDQGLEEKVREILENLKGTTVIAIAHRLVDPLDYGLPSNEAGVGVGSDGINIRAIKRIPGWFRNGRVIEIRDGVVLDEGYDN